MNYFENKLVSFYSYEANEEVNIYLEHTIDRKPICTCYCDIQPSSKEVIQKEFGEVANAKYIMWTEISLDNKVEKNTIVLFDYHGETQVCKIEDIKTWDDFSEFIVSEIPPSMVLTDPIQDRELPDPSEVEGSGKYG